MFDRILTTRLQNVFKNVLLLGPRQVGKTTLIRSLNPDLLINLADESLFVGYSKDPARFGREVRALGKASLIAIDEVQRVPSLLNSVQAILDEGSPHKFLLTGSSARKLKRSGVNLLPGRILLEYLDPLSIWELGDHFDLEKALQTGSLPGVCLDTAFGPDILESYATVYLREEIQAEAVAKNIGAYARFLDVAAESSGQWINYSKMASDSEIPKETVRRFYGILEDTLLVFRIPPFKTKETKRRISQRDRFLFFDLGVRNALLKIHRQPVSPVEKGFLFEQWFILQCLFYNRAHHKNWRISSYRTDAGVEVDMILDRGDRFLAIECKYGKTVSEPALGGLRSFESIAHKPVEKYVVYQGETRQKFLRGELAIPYREFLLEILTGL